MKKIITGLLLFACTMPVYAVSPLPVTHSKHLYITTKPATPADNGYTQLLPPTDPDNFTFTVTGDNRSTGYGYPMPPSLNQICKEIGIVGPAFTLWTGDVIEGFGDSVDEANREYDEFLKSAHAMQSPLFNAPGNHEFELDGKLLPIYKKRMGELYGSFDYGNSHFIVLNSVAVYPDGKTVAGDIDPEQMEWLTKDLEANQKAANIFVSLHHYVFGPADDNPDLDSGLKSKEFRDNLHNLFVKYGVRAVFCGHNHVYWHTNKDGIDYIISGGAGAPLDATPEKGGYLHFIAFHVNKNKVTWDILQPWHLDTFYPNGDRLGASKETVWVTNSNHIPVIAQNIVFYIQTNKDAKDLQCSAVVKYKNKSTPAKASVLSVEPADRGMSKVVVEATLKANRTTEITVGE